MSDPKFSPENLYWGAFKRRWYLPSLKYLYDILAFFICLLDALIGRKTVHWIFCCLTTFVCQFIKRERRIAEAQVSYLKRAGYLPKDTSEKEFFKQNICEIVCSTVDVFLLPKYFTSEKHAHSFIDFEASNIEDKTCSSKNNAMILSAHMGCFEIGPLIYGLRGVSVNPAARFPNNSLLRKLSQRQREWFGIKTIWREQKGAGILLLKAIRNSSSIGSLIDQDTALENEFIPFLGIDAAVPIAPLKIAKQFKLRVMLFLSVRLPSKKYKIVMKELLYDPEKPTAIEDLAKEYNKELEQFLLDSPTQWPWWHRRWRRRPGIDYEKNPELLRSTNEYVKWLNELDPKDPDKQVAL